MPVATGPEKGAEPTLPATPLHGFRGERPPPGAPALPLALSVAVSRETGSRGIVIARQTAKKLGWAYYDQERLEFLGEQQHLHAELHGNLDEAQRQWVQTRLEAIDRADPLKDKESIRELARVILALGVRGEVVFLGRGAGCILPPESTLCVRIVAPLTDRISFLAQLERLTPSQAREQVELRDQRRADFVANHFQRSPGDLCQFDLLLNSSQLGEEAATQLVVAAAKLKSASWAARRSAAEERQVETE
jgi:cytidylate kinase